MERPGLSDILQLNQPWPGHEVYLTVLTHNINEGQALTGYYLLKKLRTEKEDIYAYIRIGTTNVPLGRGG